MAIQPGQQWEINANGSKGTLNITAVDGQGNLMGTMFGDQVSGFYDATQLKITFMRVATPLDPSKIQIFTGFWMRDRSGDHKMDTLTGFFEAFAGSGGRARRVLFAWYAQIPTVTEPV